MLLSACGGGSGGESAAAPATTPAATASAVVVSAPTPSSLSGNWVVGDPPSAPTLTGTVSGNVDALAGKPIYVVVEDPNQLFHPGGALRLERTAAGFQYALSLSSRKHERSGQVSGNLRILACLDEACRQPLGGTPLTVPYNFKVEEPLTLSRTEFAVTVPFGTFPAVETIDVGWSFRSAGWVVNTLTGGLELKQETGKLLTSRVLQIALGPRQPGVTQERIRVTASDSVGATLLADREIKINYTVTPSDVDVVVWPGPVLEATGRVSEKNDLRFRPYHVIPNTGVQVRYLGTEYVLPTGVGAPVHKWWLDNLRGESSGAYTACGELGNCLAPGLHEARALWEVQSSRGQRVLSIPIRLTIEP